MTVVLKKEDMSKLSNEVVLSEDVSAPVEKGKNSVLLCCRLMEKTM